MKKCLLLLLVVCLFAPVTFAEEEIKSEQQKETVFFGGRFRAWEPLYKLDHFGLTIMARDESFEALILLRAGERYEDQRFSLKEKNDETLEELLNSMENNHRILKDGSGFDGSVADQILAVEEPHFELVKKAQSVRIFSFERKEWYLDIERIYIFYDGDGNILTAWAYSRFSQIYNFCIPEE